MEKYAAEREQLHAQYKLVNVVVAKADLRRAPCFRADRRVARGAKNIPSLGSRRSERWDEIAGRVLSRPVHSGETMLRSHLAQGAGAGFSAQLPEGMRALTFPVDEEASISGMLAPGDRIDILFTTTAANESVTVPLLFAVPVIATGLRTQANENSLPDKLQSAPFRTITVSVTPADAARITLAQDAGRITVALRQPQDPSTDSDRAHDQEHAVERRRASDVITTAAAHSSDSRRSLKHELPSTDWFVASMSGLRSPRRRMPDKAMSSAPVSVLSLPVGQSLLIRSPGVKRVSAGDGTTVDIKVFDDTQEILVLGRKAGTRICASGRAMGRASRIWCRCSASSIRSPRRRRRCRPSRPYSSRRS